MARLHPLQCISRCIVRQTGFVEARPSHFNSQPRYNVSRLPNSRSFSRTHAVYQDKVQNQRVTHKNYTTAFALFEGLWELGVKTCYVNLGSDHPSILEAIVQGKRERPQRWPQIITCPSEMVAISMADGYARVTGKPQAVIVHVDVGTQALAHGIHNASVGRVPVFLFAGLCPYTQSGELPGSRTEYQHWLQEAPDQRAIVRQYCRYTNEIRSGLNVKQSVARALQFATSESKGPVYLCAARETLAENIQEYSLDSSQWKPIGPGALPTDAVEEIADALLQAKRPLIITGYSGRDRRCPTELVKLADSIPSLRVHETAGSDMCFPFNHPASRGFRLGFDDCTRDADAVLILNCDVPWIPSRNPPPNDARIYHIDVDPLNQQIPVSFFPAHGRWRADCYTALQQLSAHLSSSRSITYLQEDSELATRRQARQQAYEARLQAIANLADLDSESQLSEHNVGSTLKKYLPEETVFVMEAVTAASSLNDQIQPSRPGQWINCGGAGIGWSPGAALGIRLALDAEARDEQARSSLVCQVVGDGSYLDGSPSSAAWVAAKYRIPILTLVLNNGGWKAPRNSTELVYPNGLNKNASDEEMNLSFVPSPDYAQLAEAAAGPFSSAPPDRWIKGRNAANVRELQAALIEGRELVGERKGGMLINVMTTRDT